MRPIGFSTGALAYGDFRRALSILQRCQTTTVAVELSALREHELAPLAAAVADLDLGPFDHVAVHAPSAVAASNERHVIDLLTALVRRGFQIIVHPDAVHDWSLWRRLGPSLCLENMDKRKPIGRSCTELRQCFLQVPEAGFCLDLGHARQVDPTMTEATLMLREFAGRLRQIHLSEVCSDSTHERISFTAAVAFRRVAKLIPERTPIILETPVKEQEIGSEIRRAAESLQPNAGVALAFRPAHTATAV